MENLFSSIWLRQRMSDKFPRRKIPYVMPLHWTEWTSALNVSNWIIYIFTQFSLTRKLSSLEYDLPFFACSTFNPRKKSISSPSANELLSWFKLGGKWKMALITKHIQALSVYPRTLKAENSTNEILIENYIKCFGKAIKVALYLKICAVLFHIDEYIIF